MRRSILLILPFSSLAYGWISNQQRTFAVSRTYAKGGDEIPKSAELETNDPCWQTMLDDDCSMGNIYSANFVASKWIKSMPCGEGIEVSLSESMIHMLNCELFGFFGILTRRHCVKCYCPPSLTMLYFTL